MDRAGLGAAGLGAPADPGDDYMSEKFLAHTPEAKRSTVRKRPAPQPKQLPKKEAERKILEEGLSRQIDTSNKGFQLMSKMGFKPGMGLGKDEAGMKAPLPVQIRENRSGLGKEEEDKRKQEEAMQKRAKVEIHTVESFKAQQAAKFKERHLLGQLKEAKQIAYQLDVEGNVKDSAYAPQGDSDDDLNERGRGALRDRQPRQETDTSTPTLAQLPEAVHQVVAYLRSRYFYCFFCGIKYASIDALRARCPGDTEEAHE